MRLFSSDASRRNFLAAGIGALASPLIAQPSKAARIDIHHHFLPPQHVERVLTQRENGPAPQWSVQRSLEEMDRNGVRTSVVSLVPPGLSVGGPAGSREMARLCNEFAARMIADHPGRFGSFAAIPLSDVEGSLREIEYAFDTLHADGIGLMTQFDNKYLGDPAFMPVFEELNRRKAIVYVHPTQPPCCLGLVKGVPVGTIEYAADTTRTIASLLFSGAAARFPEIRFIFSHGGGTVPFLLGRFERLAEERKDSFLDGGAAPTLRKFYYEIAQAHHRGALDGLLRMAPISNVLFGSDFPLRPVEEAVTGLMRYGMNSTQRLSIERDNALRLIPRLRA